MASSTFLVVVASLIRRISFETVTIGSLILREMRPSSSFMEKFSDRVKVACILLWYRRQHRLSF